MKHKQHLFIIAACSAITGLLFGYDAGIISGALLFISKTFIMNSSVEGWLVAMVPLGALVSSILSGEICDLFGRKKTIFLTAVTFTVGSLISAIAPSALMLMIGRLIIGIAIGIGSSAAPVYTSELANERDRGWLTNLFICLKCKLLGNYIFLK